MIRIILKYKTNTKYDLLELFNKKKNKIKCKFQVQMNE